MKERRQSRDTRQVIYIRQAPDSQNSIQGRKKTRSTAWLREGIRVSGSRVESDAGRGQHPPVSDDSLEGFLSHLEEILDILRTHSYAPATLPSAVWATGCIPRGDEAGGRQRRRREGRWRGGGGRGEERGKALLLQHGAGLLPQNDDSERLMRHSCVCNIQHPDRGLITKISQRPKPKPTS
jgi:hypothetical protein